MSLSTITVVLLSLLTLGNLFLLLGVIRKLRELAANQASRPTTDLPTIGSRVPDFAESTIDGGQVSAGDLRTGSSLVVFLSPSCKVCTATTNRLAEREAGLPDRIFVFVDAEDGNYPLVGDIADKLHSIGPIALVTTTSPATTAFQVTGYPAVMLVDRGVVTAAAFDLDDVLPHAHERASTA